MHLGALQLTQSAEKSLVGPNWAKCGPQTVETFRMQAYFDNFQPIIIPGLSRPSLPSERGLPATPGNL